MGDLLRQNSELRRDRIWNFSIPAWFVVLPDGTRFMTCPNAGPCAQVCYARNGTYRFPKVLEAHTRNLTHYLDDPAQWKADMLAELQRRKFRPSGVARDLPASDDAWLMQWAANGGAAVRIHDAGDFFSQAYLLDWLAVAQQTPDVLFYAYTKEVAMFRATPQVREVPNFRYLFSTGGLQDNLIDAANDRHADVFPTLQAMEEHDYESQDASDLLAVALPTVRIGITANNIPHFVKRMRGRRFSELRPSK